MVAFSTVRLFLIVSMILDWPTCSIDFANAFVQATNPTTTYVKIPLGFRSSKGNTILKLLKSLYGHDLAPRLFFNLLFQSLTKLEFIQNLYDEFLWYRDNIFIIIFVDDCGICAETVALIDEHIADLEKMGFKLTKESTFTEFLGIQYTKIDTNHVHLTQEGLIKKYSRLPA